MPQWIQKRSHKSGMPPGSLIHIGEKKTEKIKITLLEYDADHSEEKVINHVEELFPCKTKASISWINIDGLHDVEILKRLDIHLGIHPLVLEDILNTEQRPKVDDYGEYIFVVLKMLYLAENKKDIVTEQVSLILAANYVISFQEEGTRDVFETIRDRIRNDKGRIRKLGTDALAYSLIDATVDYYFVILEMIGAEIEVLEEKLIKRPTSDIPEILHKLRRDMIFLRKQVWPTREVVNNLQRNESSLLQKSTMIYFRDVYDHTIQIIDTIDSFRDILGGLHDIYLSSISNRLNEIMKVLTIFTAVFIPLTFIAGIYGMNFKSMPELEWRYGYFMVLGVMALTGVCMIVYFKKKKWI